MHAKLILLIVGTTLMAGCKTPGRFNQNITSGRNIVLAANVFSGDAIDKFPVRLDELVSAHFLKSVPRCICQDGKPREFVYISGFGPPDGNNWTILTTPPEMDSQRAIIFRADATAEIVTREDATSELQKSRDYLKQRDQKLK